MSSVPTFNNQRRVPILIVPAAIYCYTGQDAITMVTGMSSYSQKTLGDSLESPERHEVKFSLSSRDDIACNKPNHATATFTESVDSKSYISSVYINIDNRPDNSSWNPRTRFNDVSCNTASPRQHETRHNLSPVAGTACSGTNFSRVTSTCSYSYPVTMAAATRPTIFFSSKDVSQNIVQSTRQPVSLGTYRIIGRQAHALLSDGGIVFPSSTQATSPFLQKASATSTTSLITESKNIRHQSSSDDLFAADQDAHSRTMIVEDVRASDSGYGDHHPDSHSSTRAVVSMPRLTPLPADNILSESHKSSPFLRNMKARIKGRKISSSDRRSTDSTNAMCLDQEETHARHKGSICEQKERNSHEQASVDSPSSHTNDVGHATAMKELMTLQESSTANSSVGNCRRGKQTTRSQSVARESASMKTPKARSLSVIEVKSISLGTEGSENDHKNSDRLTALESEQICSDVFEELASPKQVLTGPGGVQKSRSKFLTELYSGAEKIKRFINRGKIKKDNKMSSVHIATQPSERQDVRSHSGVVSTSEHQNQCGSPRKSSVNIDSPLGNSRKEGSTMDETIVRSAHSDTEYRPVSNNAALWQLETTESCSHAHDHSTQSLLADDESGVSVSETVCEQTHHQYIDTPRQSIADASIPKLKLQHEYSFEATLIRSQGEPQWKVQETPAVHSRRRLSLPDTKPDSEHEADLSTYPGRDTPGLSVTSRSSIVRQSPRNHRLLSDTVVEPHVSTLTADARKHADNAVQKLGPATANNSNHTEKNITLQSEPRDGSHNNRSSTLHPAMIKYTFDKNDSSQGQSAQGTRQSDILNDVSQAGVGELTGVNNKYNIAENYVLNTAGSVAGNCLEHHAAPAGCETYLCPVSPEVIVPRNMSHSNTDSCRQQLTASHDTRDRSRTQARINVLKTQLQSHHDNAEPPASENSPPAQASDTVIPCPDSTLSVGAGSSKYEAITSLPELQRLLSETQDPAERRTIRDAIRRLRYRPESVPFGIEFKLHTAQFRSSTRHTSQTETLSSLENDHQGSSALTPSTLLQSSPALTHSTGTSSYSPSVSGLNTIGAKFAQSENTSHKALIGGDRQLDSFDLNRDSNILDTKTPGHPEISSLATPASEGYSTYHICDGPRRRPTADTADTAGSLADQVQDVSSVIKHVKARLNSRSESLTSQSKHSNIPSLFDQVSLPPTPGQIFKVKSGFTVHTTGDKPDKKRISSSGGPSPTQVLERPSENASEKYKEARNKILRSSNIKDLSIKANDNDAHIKPYSRQYVGPLVSASQTTLSLNVASAPNAKECSPDVQDNVTQDQKRFEIDWNPEPHDRAQQTLTSSLRQHKLPPEADEISQTGKSAKQYSSSLIVQIPPGAANFVTLETRPPDTLSDIQKQERGDRLPTSTALVSSLAVNCSPSGDQDKSLGSSNLQRSKSLNLKLVNCSHSDSGEGKSPLHATAISSSSAQLEADSTSTATRDDQSVDRESNTPQPRTLASLADSSAAQTTTVRNSQISGNSESKGRSEFAGRISSDLELTAMQSKTKSTIKRSKPVGRSLTESHITRPRIYTSHLEVQMMPKMTDTADSKCIMLNEPIQWKVGNITDRFLVDSVNKYSGSTMEPTKRSIHGSRSFLSRSQVQMSNMDTPVQPVTVQLVQTKDQTDNAFKQSTSVDTDLNGTSVVGSTSRQAQMQKQAASPAPQLHDWNVCSRQPATTMEKAFSMLLEELDKISGSEGNPSDLDLSDGEDWVTITGASRTKGSTIQQSPKFESIDVSEHPARGEVWVLMTAPSDECQSDQLSDSGPVNAEQSGPVSVAGAAISVVSRGSNSGVRLPVQGRLQGMSAQEDIRSQPVLSSLALSPSLCQSDLSTTDATPTTGSAAVPQVTSTLQATGDTITSQKQSGDRMMRQVSDISEDETHDASANNLTTDEIIHCYDNNITNGSQTSKVILQTDRAEEISSDRLAHLSSCHTTITSMAAEDKSDGDSSMRITSAKLGQPLGNIDNLLGSATVDVSDNNDHLIRMQVTNSSMADGDTTDSTNNNIMTSASARHGQAQDDIDNFLGTGIIDVSKNDDGTITVQAVAEDRSQNKTVTVRTKTHRTPSNASEELRDTIVERKTRSPGGAVLVERDVIQTKNRLTSRGSNYYSRSAYTLRTRREQGGAETVEHSVCVENENKSVSQGHSWGDKAVAQVTFVDASCAASVAQVPGSTTDEIPRSSAEGMRNHQYSQLDLHPCKSRDKHSNGVADMRATQHRTEPAAEQGQGPPTFEKRLIDVSVTEGHSTILSCTVTGAVSLEWYQNGVLKRNSADFKQFYDGREARLQIGEVFLDDAGQYICIAKNNAGEQRSSCTLHVVACDQETVVVPMFLTKLTSREVIQGQMLILECDVIGSPEPIITWLKDGKQLDGSLTYSTSYDGRLASLQISTMRFQDTGCYMCVAENPAGRVSIDAIVTVQAAHQAPHFVSKLENKSAVAGDGIILQCEVTGCPLPFVSWRKDGRLIHTSSNCVQSFHNKVARLEIVRASPQDSSCYECVAKNPVSEIACQCHVQVLQQTKYQPEETTAPREEQIIPSLQKVTKNRVVKKLSEPRPADIIAAVIQRASSHGVQRAQSFTPGSSVISRERFMVGQDMEDKLSNSQLHNVHSTVNQPQTVSVVRNTITIPPRSNIHTRHTESNITSLQGNDLHTNPDVQTEKHYGISRTPSLKISEPAPHPVSTSLRVTNLGRSSSMNMGRSSNQLPHAHNIQSSGSVKSLWTAPSTDQLVPRETITKSFSQEVVSDLRPASPIVGYRPVLPVFAASLAKDRPAQTSSMKYLSSSGSNIANSHAESVLTEQTSQKDRNYVPSSSMPSLPLTRSYVSDTMEPYSISTSPSSTSSYSIPSSRLAQKSPAQGISQPLQEASETKVQVPSVNALRQHFMKNDQVVAASVSNSSTRNTTGGVRRWDSLPLQGSKPIVFQRKSTPGASRLPTMPSYDNINDEEELHKLMNATDDFEERKKIRARIREIREKQREETEAKRKQREAEAEDLVKKKFERAEEEKRRKMEAYKQQAPTHERDSKYHEVSQNLIQEKYKAAEEEKARKLAAYNTLATTTKTGPGGSETKIAISTTTEKTPGGGVRTVTQKTSETKGFGGTSYGKPAAKPQGPKSAMAAFKQLDTTNNPDSAAKPKAMVRSPTAIKQILLDWAKAMTQGYPEVEVTNFSTSWNNGMAFCALIHHFFPNAFDFSKLDPKQRRYNFTLAFDTAEKEADIAPLLDVEDMVKMKNPDWKCVFTYVQSIYRHLKDHENNKAGPIEQ